ncbi:hypothetical protein TNCV_3533491 [Trichonephila clavipes]|nr:hypothetical protein TNCV_3533491 [Trichonephila clavipes]
MKCSTSGSPVPEKTGKALLTTPKTKDRRPPSVTKTLRKQWFEIKKTLTGFFGASESAFAMSSGSSGGFICWFSSTTV